MDDLSELQQLVKPPQVKAGLDRPQNWSLAEQRLGITLPQELLLFNLAYGSGVFIHEDTRQFRIVNLCSRIELAGTIRMQDALRELKQHSSAKQLPYNMLPLIPGLFFLGSSRLPIVFFYHFTRAYPAVFEIVFRNYCEQWIQFDGSLVAFVASMLQNQIRMWDRREFMADDSGIYGWQYVPDTIMTQSNQSVLHEAIVSNDIEQIRLLLQSGADANEKNSVGRTPLCSTSDKEAVALLLAHGADPNLSGDDGWTPLDVAVRSDTSAEVVELLLNAGANPNNPGPTGFTPFTYCCKQGDFDIVRVLLHHGADVQRVDSRGNTPLQAARRRPDVQELLRSSGATE